MEIIPLAGTILGGLGLFLLAISMMTEGLKLAAGSQLRKLLSEWSKTPLRGIFTGFSMTAIIQSSSAVTVASLGFVNAGLINMRQALGIVYGSNIGTTVTGWLVALIGFKFSIQSFALPMIGLGMVMKLVNQRGKAASFGLALVGFGLFFVGIDVLKNAFDSVVQIFDISQFSAEGVTGIIVFLLIGIVMTILTQSSSASIALTITAASSGMVGIYAAAAMVIGANVGTTSTAIIGTIGATPNAKRVAAAQVIFNVTTALVAFIILPVLFFLINRFSQFFNLDSDPAITLALFHTVFNLLGVLLVYPHNDRLASFLEKRFQTREESVSRPQYLDKTIAQTPVLAINALTLETLAISDKVKSLYAKAIIPDSLKLNAFEKEVEAIKTLTTEVAKFIVNIERVALADETTIDLATLMRIEQYLLSCTLSTERLAYQLQKREKQPVLSLENELNFYLERVLGLMNSSRLSAQTQNEYFSTQINELQTEHDRMKAVLISEGTRSHISVNQMSETIDCLAEALRLAQHWYKAYIRLQNIQIELSLLENEVKDNLVNT